ncbi:hypothetical protein BU14_0203s0013 [Porphyra umbilicalis]|uniref:Uncharacterized protein n=1 Tax=Porphyra umbilicalis TaxID=2786 RepID=A0A1X6P5P0_PORUM|nr:hypothetical protein BU14_0203s0013 [Porphyra umbilicalis]|eukprot:OSX76202.1 hypothetical protein BU14_0203s0013 [Porphyra umbilicalis]
MTRRRLLSSLRTRGRPSSPASHAPHLDCKRCTGHAPHPVGAVAGRSPPYHMARRCRRHSARPSGSPGEGVGGVAREGCRFRQPQPPLRPPLPATSLHSATPLARHVLRTHAPVASRHRRRRPRTSRGRCRGRRRPMDGAAWARTPATKWHRFGEPISRPRTRAGGTLPPPPPPPPPPPRGNLTVAAPTRWRVTAARDDPTASRAAAPAPQTAATLEANDGADGGGGLTALATPRAMAATAVGGSSRGSGRSSGRAPTRTDTISSASIDLVEAALCLPPAAATPPRGSSDAAAAAAAAAGVPHHRHGRHSPVSTTTVGSWSSAEAVSAPPSPVTRSPTPPPPPITRSRTPLPRAPRTAAAAAAAAAARWGGRAPPPPGVAAAADLTRLRHELGALDGGPPPPPPPAPDAFFPAPPRPHAPPSPPPPQLDATAYRRHAPDAFFPAPPRPHAPPPPRPPNWTRPRTGGTRPCGASPPTPLTATAAAARRPTGACPAPPSCASTGGGRARGGPAAARRRRARR